MAKAGFGKRHAPDEAPRGAADFVHLPAREAAIAAYVDRLPEGAAIGYKVLADELPDFGQQACRSALDRLTRAGHLRRVRVQIKVEGSGLRWVTRTFFSRTARDAAWWKKYIRFINGVDVPGQPQAAPAEAAPGPSESYTVLAGLGRREPRLQLSEDECVSLEPLVREWLARGVGREQASQMLVAGLPASVHSAGAFLRTRLENKMPPAPRPKKNEVHEEIVAALEMCAFCDEDESTATLVDGVCADCRADIDRDEANGTTGDVPDTFLARPRQRTDVADKVAGLRAEMGRPSVPGARAGR
ncbi:hypothetical protein ACIQOF_36850 [Streptomyces sp. NPDC091265]|uniref:hypothetical protein n=1 Tax=unclassified Streptomyces TaxID=2593676 RepID=UPI00344C77EF